MATGGAQEDCHEGALQRPAHHCEMQVTLNVFYTPRREAEIAGKAGRPAEASQNDRQMLAMAEQGLYVRDNPGSWRVGKDAGDAEDAGR